MSWRILCTRSKRDSSHVQRALSCRTNAKGTLQVWSCNSFCVLNLACMLGSSPCTRPSRTCTCARCSRWQSWQGARRSCSSWFCTRSSQIVVPDNSLHRQDDHWRSCTLEHGWAPPGRQDTSPSPPSVPRTTSCPWEEPRILTSSPPEPQARHCQDQTCSWCDCQCANEPYEETELVGNWKSESWHVKTAEIQKTSPILNFVNFSFFISIPWPFVSHNWWRVSEELDFCWFRITDQCNAMCNVQKCQMPGKVVVMSHFRDCTIISTCWCQNSDKTVFMSKYPNIGSICVLKSTFRSSMCQLLLNMQLTNFSTDECELRFKYVQCTEKKAFSVNIVHTVRFLLPKVHSPI